jgi:PKHD-type hydroxylase
MRASGNLKIYMGRQLAMKPTLNAHISAYPLPPSPDRSTNEQILATWEDGFAEGELTEIRRLGDAVATTAATANNANYTAKNVRQSSLGWLSLTAETEFIHERLGIITQALNGQHFDFNIWGFVEPFQYVVYRGRGDHYGWHMDKGNTFGSPRKLSIVLQLSDPSEFEGGDLELWVGGDKPFVATKQQGLLYMFPSWVLHRVTPVTAGCRRTLVVWVAGEKFK